MVKPADFKKEEVAEPAMFFAGLILLIPHRIGMSRVNYVIKRYNLPISRAGLLLYKFHNPIEVSLTIGTFLGNLIVWIFNWATKGSVGTKEKEAIKWIMFGFLSLMFASSIIMYIVYIIGSDYGYLDLFYFSLILITLFDGFSNALAFALNAKNAALLAAGIPTSGALVSLLHNIYKFFSDSFHLDDFDYHVLRIQLLCNVITLLATCLLWMLFDESKSHPAGFNLGALFNNDNYGDWSPIGMLAISLGTVYAFYPSIAPYSIIDYQYASIIDYQYASVIELWILIISAIPTLVIAVLDYTEIGKNDQMYKIGPGGLILVGNASDKNGVARIKYNWYTPIGTDSGKTLHSLWHCVWVCAIPYILCIQIFMTMLHYPDSLLSSFFNNKYRIGFISVLFNTVRESMQACGFAGAGKQTNKLTTKFVIGGEWKDSSAGTQQDEAQVGGAGVNGSIASTNKLITLFIMMFCVFTGDGYLQHYRRCCRDCWPTTGFNKYQSFRYWLRYGFKGGSKSFRTSFTDMYHRNIRPHYILCVMLIMILFRLVCFYRIYRTLY